MPAKDKVSKGSRALFPPVSLFPSAQERHGGMAQLARASALQAEGPGFESLCLQSEGFFTLVSAGMERIIWSSEHGFMEDAWEPPGEEGRGQLRKAVGRCQRPTIHGCPNGVTRRPLWPAPAS